MNLARPQREGHRLTEDGEFLYELFRREVEDYGCTCFQSPPCGFCTHEGHPLALEEDDSMWEKDEPEGVNWEAHKQFMRGL